MKEDMGNYQTRQNFCDTGFLKRKKKEKTEGENGCGIVVKSRNSCWFVS
jgi:hypothetical protein